LNRRRPALMQCFNAGFFEFRQSHIYEKQVCSHVAPAVY